MLGICVLNGKWIWFWLCYNLKQLQKYFNLTSSFIYTNSGFYNNLAYCQLSQEIGNFS